MKLRILSNWKIWLIMVGLLALSLFIFLPTARADVYDATTVHPATMEEIAAFLEEDTTGNHTYNLLTYNCFNFAIDLWWNAYREGFDAFLIVLNKEGVKSHFTVGFYTVEKMPQNCVEYWGEDNQWFFVDPQEDAMMARGDPGDPLDKHNWEIINFIQGGDVLELWQALHGGSKIPIIKLHGVIMNYKVVRLLG